MNKTNKIILIVLSALLLIMFLPILVLFGMGLVITIYIQVVKDILKKDFNDEDDETADEDIDEYSEDNDITNSKSSQLYQENY
jgi:hypothetical protein